MKGTSKKTIGKKNRSYKPSGTNKKAWEKHRVTKYYQKDSYDAGSPDPWSQRFQSPNFGKALLNETRAKGGKHPNTTLIHPLQKEPVNNIRHCKSFNVIFFYFSICMDLWCKKNWICQSKVCRFIADSLWKCGAWSDFRTWWCPETNRQFPEWLSLFEIPNCHRAIC